MKKASIIILCLSLILTNIYPCLTYANGANDDETEVIIEELFPSEDILPANTLFLMKFPGIIRMSKMLKSLSVYKALNDTLFSMKKAQIIKLTERLLKETDFFPSNLNINSFTPLLENPVDFTLIGFYQQNEKVQPGFAFIIEKTLNIDYNPLLYRALETLRNTSISSDNITTTTFNNSKITCCSIDNQPYIYWTTLESKLLVSPVLPALYTIINQYNSGIESSLGASILFQKTYQFSKKQKTRGPFFYLNASSLASQFALLLPDKIKSFMAVAGFFSVLSIGGGLNFIYGGIEHWLFFYTPGNKAGIFELLSNSTDVQNLIKTQHPGDLMILNISLQKLYAFYKQLTTALDISTTNSFNSYISSFEKTHKVSLDSILTMTGNEILLSNNDSGMIFRIKLSEPDAFKALIADIAGRNPETLSKEFFSEDTTLYYLNSFNALEGTFPTVYIENSYLYFSFFSQPIQEHILSQGKDVGIFSDIDRANLQQRIEAPTSIFLYKDIAGSLTSLYLTSIPLLQLLNIHFEADLPVFSLPCADTFKKYMYGFVSYTVPSDDGLYAGFLSPVGLSGALIPHIDSSDVMRLPVVIFNIYQKLIKPDNAKKTAANSNKQADIPENKKEKQ